MLNELMIQNEQSAEENTKNVTVQDAQTAELT